MGYLHKYGKGAMKRDKLSDLFFSSFAILMYLTHYFINIVHGMLSIPCGGLLLAWKLVVKFVESNSPYYFVCIIDKGFFPL